MTSGLRFYVLFVAALGAAALAQSLRTLNLSHVDPLMLVILIGLAAAAQRMPVFLFENEWDTWLKGSSRSSSACSRPA